MSTRLAGLTLALIATSVVAQQSASPKYQQGANASSTNAQKGTAPAAQKAGRYSYSPQFTGADRDTVRTCMRGTYGNPGVQVRPLSAAMDKQVQVGSKLPAGLQSRAQALPDMCASRLLMTLPAGWSRVLVGNHVLLLDASAKVSDMFDLN